MDENLNAHVQTDRRDRRTYPRVARILDNVVRGCIAAAVFLVPVIVLPWTMDVLELNKQTLFLVLMLVGFAAWSGEAMARRAVIVTRSWLHIVVIAYLAGYGLISAFSMDPYLSLVGHSGQQQWSFITLVGFGLLYFLLTQKARDPKQAFRLVLLFLLSSGLVVLASLANVFGVPLFSWLGEAAADRRFNTIGNINSLGVFLSVPMLVAAALLTGGKSEAGSRKVRMAEQIFLWSVVGVSAVATVLIDFWVVWATLIFGSALLLTSAIVRTKRLTWSLQFIVPGAIVLLSVFFLFARPLVDLGLGAEVAPSLAASWGVARETLQERPLTGSGPGTWVYDYAQYHPSSINLTPFWAVRFERGISSFLTLFATAGLVGISLWLVLLVSGAVKGTAAYVLDKERGRGRLVFAVLVGWASLAFISFVYNYNVAHHFAFWLFFGLLVSLVAKSTLAWDLRKSVVHSGLFSFAFLLVLAGSFSGGWLLSQGYVSDAYMASGVKAFRAAAPLDSVAAKFQSAIALNPWNDAAYRNLSQLSLMQTQSELTATMDEETSKRVNVFVRTAVDSARMATEIAPANVLNWINFGSVLRAIAAFTPGADEQAIAMYLEALKYEPNNPSLWNEIGELYVLRADAYATLVNSPDQEARDRARTNAITELDRAHEALNQSVQMKPDYIPAHYNLALVYERQNRTGEAIVKLEQVLQANPQEVGVAFQLAILYYKNNEKPKSQNMLEQIVSFDPVNSNARWYLSVLYEEQGRYDDALVQVRKVEEYNAGNQMVLERLDALTKLRDGSVLPEPPIVIPEPVEEEQEAIQ